MIVLTAEIIVTSGQPLVPGTRYQVLNVYTGYRYRYSVVVIINVGFVIVIFLVGDGASGIIILFLVVVVVRVLVRSISGIRRRICL